jgi:hypothetical protein
MKQLIKLFLLIFYVFFNAGISYSLHYCEDELKRINFYTEAKTCCESEAPMPGCCDDISHLELPNSDQKQLDLLKSLNKPKISGDAIVPLWNHYSLNYSTNKVDFQAWNSYHPIDRKLPLYIYNNIFLL